MYCTPIWSPYLLRNIDQLKSVQHFFTRSLLGMLQLPYHECLTTLVCSRLKSVEFIKIACTSIRFGVILLIQNLITCLPFRSDLSLIQLSLRGNCLIFCISKFYLACCKHNFAVFVAHYWNALFDCIFQSVPNNVFLFI